jgi:gamma-glutamyltranspeptidase/glutathione hydrolase
LRDVVAPCVRLARDGFSIGRDVARCLADHWKRTRGGTAELASVFFPAGRPPAEGELLVQPELAETLEAVAAHGVAPLRSGPIVDAVCRAVRSDGGFLDPAHFLRDAVAVGEAGSVAFGSASVYGPPRETSGAGVLFSALEKIDPAALGEVRDATYVAALAAALSAAWRERADDARAALAARHTTSLCAADADGGLVTLTFTHGSLLFGSGLVAPGTGIILNAGANLFANGPGGPRAVTNMSPVVIEEANGVRHALGGTGGPRIPGILLTAVVDVVHYGATLAAALAAPHLTVRALDGALEAEPELLKVAGRGLELGPHDFGPASGITLAAGGAVAATDPRFDSGVAAA